MKERIDAKHRSIHDQAAEWFVRWHSGEVQLAERLEYVRWLKTSKIHIAELLRVCRMYSWLSSMRLRLFDEELAFEAELRRAARTYPVDTYTLIRQAREEIAADPSEDTLRLEARAPNAPER